MSERPLDPAEPQPMPDDAGDAYVAHATPGLGTRRHRRALLLGFVPAIAVAVGIALWFVFST